MLDFMVIFNGICDLVETKTLSFIKLLFLYFLDAMSIK